MKKIILSLTVAAFAFVPALQAGEGKACDKAKAACADKAKATTCCASKANISKKLAKADVKGATLLVMR